MNDSNNILTNQTITLNMLCFGLPITKIETYHKQTTLRNDYKDIWKTTYYT